jgi:DNA-binding transcriptional ArsR family regulator
MNPIANGGGGIVSWHRTTASRPDKRAESDVSGQTEQGQSKADAGAADDAGGKTPDPGSDGSGRGPPAETRAEAEAEAEAQALPLDQIFEILKNSRRRQTLHYLDENRGEASLSELAEHIAAIENDVSVGAITSSQRKRVYVGLYQCHLPKMNDMDIIDFEKNRGTVERGPNVGQLEPYLGREEDTEWYRLYASVTAVGIGLFAVSTLGSAPFGLMTTTVLVAFLSVMALCTAGHFYVEGLAGSDGA